jgi:hypothetical protein
MNTTNIAIGVVVVVVILIAAYFMMGSKKSEVPAPEAPAPEAPAPEAPAPEVPAPEAPPATPSEYVYEFIKNVESAHKKDFNAHITDIRMDGVRVTPEQIVLHEEPKHAKCNSKPGGYQCQSGNYGLNDPEPANPTMKDLTWSAWKEGQIPVGSKVFTITTPTKVGEFEIDYFRPKYAPGWIIKENGVEVLKETVNGGGGNTPNPKKIKYIIP